MKIIIDDQYQNDENKQYTVDENGNINLYIDIEDEEKTETAAFNNNIDLNKASNIIQDDFFEFKEENNIEKNLIEGNIAEINNIEINNIEISDSEIGSGEKEEFIVGNAGNYNFIEYDNEAGSTINNENPLEEEKYSRNYHSIYSEIENSLQERYANKEQVNLNEYEDKQYNAQEYDNNQYEKQQNQDKEYNEPNYIKQDYNNIIQERIVEEKGVIDVYSKLTSKQGIELKGARINLYMLNGVSPKLYDSKFTDEIGKASFKNLPNGCYRIIAIVDRRYFEKPIYYNWNEVTIDSNNKTASVIVVNKIKQGYYRNNIKYK